MRSLLYILPLLFFAGIGFAFFVAYDGPTSTWIWHLLQWCPVLIGAVCYFIAGYTFSGDTGWAWFGKLGSLIVIPGVGYVFGRVLFIEIVVFVIKIFD